MVVANHHALPVDEEGNLMHGLIGVHNLCTGTGYRYSALRSP